MIEYQKILNKNMLNVFKEIMKQIKVHGLSNNNHLYITFVTNHKHNRIPEWIREKYPNEMTIVIQYEYYDISVNKNDFTITLSFNNIKTDLKIGYEAIISFADPSVNFGLVLKQTKIKKNIKKELDNKDINKDNVINFLNYKKH